MILSELKIIKWVVTAFRFCFWLFRKSGVSDFMTLVVLAGIASVLLVVGFLFSFQPISDYFGLLNPNYRLYLRYLTVLALLVLGFALLYALRLRKMGIASADAEITTGIDYKSALKLVTNEFNFLGIGASKLTSNSAEFTSALARVQSHKKITRLLLCDPRAPIVSRLEKISDVGNGSYLVRVKGSFSLLQHLQERFDSALEVRVYKPKTEEDLITLRLMFVNGKICLLSQNLLGKESKEGRSAPQLLIDSGALTNSSPTLYTAFSALFEQMWNRPNTKHVTDADFKEIAALTSG